MKTGQSKLIKSGQYSPLLTMALYSDHATSEQFHSEFKTDLDLERLPSGKFDTNNLAMAFATMGYNVLFCWPTPTPPSPH